MSSLATIDWQKVEESESAFERLTPGAYVLEIVTAYEGTSRNGKPYVGIVWDVYEGKFKGHYSDKWGKEHEFAHEERIYYGTTGGRGVFKGFLNRIEESNGSFTVTGWQQAGAPLDMLNGLTVGAAVRKRLWVNGEGEEKEALEVARWHSVSDVRAGKVPTPSARDEREQSERDEKDGKDAAGYDGEFIPF